MAQRFFLVLFLFGAPLFILGCGEEQTHKGAKSSNLAIKKVSATPLSNTKTTKHLCFFMMQSPLFVEQLRLDESQQNKFAAIHTEFVKKKDSIEKQMLRKINMIPEEPQQSFQQRAAKELEAYGEECQIRLDGFLNDSQIERGKELVFMLFRGFSQPQIDISTLFVFDFTQEQHDKVSDLLDKYKSEQKVIASTIGPQSMILLNGKLENLHIDLVKSIKGLLTQEQQTKCEKLEAEMPSILALFANKK